MSDTRTAPCSICGVDTNPSGEGFAEFYMVHDELWAQATAQAGMEDGPRFLCILCIEGCLGRPLMPEDFKPDVKLNDLSINPETSTKAYAFRSQRLIARLSGQMELIAADWGAPDG